ncbi:hypothetical protein BGZ95_009687 [Linnemannia exigua]|uniref:Uncharacterized protein n=1 Tax=Linnemannia exigua TaxID=604196 RepID=A0AAD4DE56_9FUNG|nr:hypothetical protein BGZ95_009687 [Linnemannia exigua]
MQLAQKIHQGNPLDLTEVRSRIALFLGRSDCLACMRVSRDWFRDFVRPVWHTIDFSKDALAFSTLSSDTLNKYGGYISDALNITILQNVQALQHAKVDSLKVLQVHLGKNWLFRSMLSDLLRRSHGSTTSLSFRGDTPVPDTLDEQRNRAINYMSVNDMFAPFPSFTDRGSGANFGSRLTTLSLTHICFTREGFSSLLQYCPSLDKLALDRVIILYHKNTIPLYTGSKLRFLSSSFAQAWVLDTLDVTAPHLLNHFPLLEQWNITSLGRPSTWMTTDPIRVNFSLCCPLLKTITFGGTENTRMISDLLQTNFKDLESCRLSVHSLDMSTTLGLIGHLDTLTSITITDKLQVAEPMPWFYLIPKVCRRLQVLSLESFALDIECVEENRWGCQDLRELRVQFKDLDAPHDIDACLKKVCDRKRIGGAAPSRPMDKDITLTRVHQHLLQFKKLRIVWLGTKDYYLPPSTV